MGKDGKRDMRCGQGNPCIATTTHQELLASIEVGAQLSAELTVGHLQILPQVTAIGHQGQVTVIADVGQLVVLTLHVGHVHVVGGGRDILVPEEERRLSIRVGHEM